MHLFNGAVPLGAVNEFVFERELKVRHTPHETEMAGISARSPARYLAVQVIPRVQ
jgi:hypothetical protein